MRRNQGVYWSQGLFLTAQHLQQQDFFHRTSLAEAWRLIAPYGWGVKTLEIHRARLSAGVFDVARCELATRDGVVLRAGSLASNPNARLEPRTFDRILEGVNRPVGVYLAMVDHTPGGPAVATGNDGGRLQHPWRLTLEQVRDAYDPDGQPSEIVFLQREMSIVFDVEPSFEHARGRCEMIRIAELIPREKGFELSLSHIAPCLSIDSSERLFTLLKDVAAQTHRRALDFADFKRERGARGTASAQDAVRVAILVMLNRYAAEFQGLIEERHAHPQAAYGILRGFVATLSSFSEDYTLTGATAEGDGSDGLPPYDHDDIRHCLELAADRISAMLRRLSAGPATAIPLELRGDLFINADPLPEEFFKGDAVRFYLVIECEMPGQDLEKALFATGKLSSPLDMAALRVQALFGLPVEYLPTPPEELPQRSSRNAYFRLDALSYQWEHVRKERAIALYSPTLTERGARVRLVRTSAE